MPQEGLTVRKVVYYSIVVYFALLVIGGGFDLIWAIMVDSEVIARPGVADMWQSIGLDGVVMIWRRFAAAVLSPIAGGIAVVWPHGAQFILSSPLVFLGVLVFVASFLAFLLADRLDRISGKR